MKGEVVRARPYDLAQLIDTRYAPDVLKEMEENVAGKGEDPIDEIGRLGADLRAETKKPEAVAEKKSPRSVRAAGAEGDTPRPARSRGATPRPAKPRQREESEGSAKPRPATPRPATPKPAEPKGEDSE